MSLASLIWWRILSKCFDLRILGFFSIQFIAWYPSFLAIEPTPAAEPEVERFLVDRDISKAAKPLRLLGVLTVRLCSWSFTDLLSVWSDWISYCTAAVISCKRFENFWNTHQLFLISKAQGVLRLNQARGVSHADRLKSLLHVQTCWVVLRNWTQN